MTRLTEALKRAQAKREGADDRFLEPDGPSAAPATWSFDGAGDPPPAAMPAPSPEISFPPVIDDHLGKRTHKEGNEQYPFAKSGKLVVGAAPDPTLVEQYRHLAACLHHAQARTAARTVMIASAVEAEGKTTTAANVALTLSHSYRRRVLLIDADLRRPSTHSLFQLDNSVGLSDVLRTQVAGGRLPVHQVSENLWVLVAGRPERDPMSGLVSDTMKQVLTDAANEFDWVVVDTPPVALLTDANLLAAMIDLALVVVSASTTPYPLVKRAVDAIGPSRILGVVLNRAKRADLSVGYGYKYGYSYGQRQKRRKWYQLASR